MAHADNVERIAVVDSDGVRGTIAARALKEVDEQVLITFDEGRRVQAPRAILRQREDGAYDLPFSLRELNMGTEALAEAGGNVVAIVPVIAEEAQIRKREVERGRVRIEKTVHTDTEQVDVALLRERVQVERVPVERYVEAPEEPHYRDDTYVIPVMEEVLVVEKRLRVREEIHVIATRDEVPHRESVELRREEVEITRVEPGTGTDSSS
jgi:uncharacterized protein (TIGR02271 family)